jgi:hypothetical protein
MGIPILTTNSNVMCPHGGTVVLTTSDASANIQGAPALLANDIHTVAGCPFVLPSLTPSPCITVRWSAPAVQTKVYGIPVLLQNSIGICYNAQQAPQGIAIIAQVQPVALGL